jgi:hypothetical protein
MAFWVFRGCAVAVAAFEDRLAIFPTSAAAGNSVVDKVSLHYYIFHTAFCVRGQELMLPYNFDFE